MGMDVLMSLVEWWRTEAAIMDAWTATQEAQAARKCAKELEAAILEWQLQTLSLSEAAEESNHSYSALQQMVSEGQMPNAGAKNKPRIYRCDMPKKPGRRSLKLVPGAPDLADQVLATG
jgi:hypothetical protein